MRGKIKYIVTLALSSVAFATGINFVLLTGLSDISVFEKCFVFGLLQLVSGKAFGEIILHCVLSSALYYVCLLAGGYSLFVFPVTAACVFGLNFKLGVVFCIIAEILRFSSLWQTAFIFAICAVVCFSVSLFAFQLLERAFIRIKTKRLDYYDGEIIKNSLTALLCIDAFVILLEGIIYFSQGSLAGLFSTLL